MHQSIDKYMKDALEGFAAYFKLSGDPYAVLQMWNDTLAFQEKISKLWVEQAKTWVLKVAHVFPYVLRFFQEISPPQDLLQQKIEHWGVGCCSLVLALDQYEEYEEGAPSAYLSFKQAFKAYQAETTVKKQ